MAVTKITVSTAMRARDVSRPRAEHFADAAEREEPGGPTAAPPPVEATPTAAEAAPTATWPPGPSDPAQAPRRRRRRGR